MSAEETRYHHYFYTAQLINSKKGAYGDGVAKVPITMPPDIAIAEIRNMVAKDAGIAPSDVGFTQFQRIQYP